jgi:stage II sporulation protein D
VTQFLFGRLCGVAARILRARVGGSRACGRIVIVVACLIGCLARASAQTLVRVLLLEHQLQTIVASPGGLVVRPYAEGSRPLGTPDVTTVLDLKPEADGLLLAGSIRTADQVLITPLTDLTLTVNGQPYRGSILVRRDAGGDLSILNILDLEQYLYSVVGSEVGAETPPAALQAQAIVARTYAVQHLGAHDELGFDLRAGNRDQAYNGVSAESVPVVDAVDATRGVVLVYRGQLVHAYYAACDGGFTADGRALGDPQPYLQSVRDPYCPFSPYMNWAASVAASDVVHKLALAGRLPSALDATSLTQVLPGPADDSGRLLSVIFVAHDKRVAVPATAFREAAGTSVVKSTRIRDLSYSSGTIFVGGAGYGHGVGMCQLGARGMAQAGFGAYAILNFYYPGAVLTQLASLATPRVAHGAATLPAESAALR